LHDDGGGRNQTEGTSEEGMVARWDGVKEDIKIFGQSERMHSRGKMKEEN